MEVFSKLVTVCTELPYVLDIAVHIFQSHDYMYNGLSNKQY